MAYAVGVETLINKRLQLVSERDNMLAEFNAQISEMESCIELLSGKKVCEMPLEERFDGLNPNYIRSSQEEI